MTYQTAFNYLMNASLEKASYEVYTTALGVFFVPVVYMITLVCVATSTKSPAATAFAALFSAAIFIAEGLLDVSQHWFFYIVCVLMLAAAIVHAFFGRDK